MSSLSKLVTTAAMAIAAIGVASSVHAQGASDKEKCYGVAKAGANDCGAQGSGHSCAGHATADGSTSDFIALPKGLCARLANGSTTAPAAAPAEAPKK